MPPLDNIILDLPGFKILKVEGTNFLRISVKYTGAQSCPRCQGRRLRIKDRFDRSIRHVLFGHRPTWLELQAYKYHCRSCGKYFNSRFPGITPRKQASEPCRLEVAKLHHKGVTQRELAKDLRMGSATVERWYQDHFRMKNLEYQGAHCPKVMGIDEHFFTRKQGYATTIADLKRHKVFDVTLGRSEPSLRSFMGKLIGKDKVQVVVMDLSEGYRSLAKKYFCNALIVADRFHVIRLVNQQFLKTWGELDSVGRKHRGLLSLMRRHPDRMKPEQKINLQKYLDEVAGLRPIYEFWQDLNQLLRNKRKTKRECRSLVQQYLWMIEELKRTKFKYLQSLGETLDNWKEEIARMFRFSKNNGITEGLHNKMEMLSRRAFGFRNFENYRLRVRVLCG
jgi:transposase